MHRSGHVGLGLLASAPLSRLALEWGDGDLALAAAVTVVALSTLPDVDHYLPGVGHRTWTHSLPFALAVGLVAGGAWMTVGVAVGATPIGVLGLVGGLAGSLSILTHLLGDVITPMGVAVYWPLSRRRRSLEAVASKNRTANLVLLAVGVVTWLALVGSDPSLGSLPVR